MRAETANISGTGAILGL